MDTNIVPVKPYQRKFLKKDVNYNQWESLSKFPQELKEQTIDSTEDLLHFLYKKNELDIIVLEQLNFYELESCRFVNAKEKNPSSKQFEEDLRANYNKTNGILVKKIVSSSFLEDLVKTNPELRLMILNVQNQDKIHSNKNESVTARLVDLTNHYKKINANQRVHVNNKEMNLFQAIDIVKDAPRSKRKETAEIVENRRGKDSKILDEIFAEMVEQRHLKAQQAGYQNYIEFIWDEKSRVDYSPEDCASVCSAIKTHFIPVYKEIVEKRKLSLGLKDIFSYDFYVDLGIAPPPVYPEDQEELFTKLKQVYNSIHPDFSKAIDYLIQEERLDFESRPNKMDAMFCMDFPESRLPFVFYSFTKSLHDIHASVHETTHAIHSLYRNHFSLIGLQQPGAEVGELFTLSMELISSEYWDVFFEDRQNFIRSKMKKLEHCLATLKMVARWDTFQRWVYLNPELNGKERNLFWDDLSKQFDTGLTPMKSIPAEKNTGWQNRPLIYFAPFYMIEYGFAQFGAFEIYRQYRENPTQTINNLIAAMKLGNSRSIQEIYKVAGVNFDFSDTYVKKVAEFVSAEYNRLFEQLEFT